MEELNMNGGKTGEEEWRACKLRFHVLLECDVIV
jgi:hypothetical protein